MTAVFTSVGAAHECDVIDKSVSSPTTHFIGWGTGAGSFTRASTQLVTETQARVAASANQPTDNTNRWSGVLTANADKTITEVGLFIVDGTASGTAKILADFSAIALISGDSIDFKLDLRRT